MGSLMAGWDSPVSESDPKSVIRKRNRSLTKEEIEAYWKLKKKTEEEHLKAISSPSDNSNQLETPFQEYGRNFARSSSLPLPNRKQGFLDMNTESLENIIKQNGWWTRSNWAFLNEPTVLERPTNSYTAQFHIANLTASKLNRDAGISA